MKQIFLMVISLLLFLSCNKENSAMEVEPPTGTDVRIRMVVGSRTFVVSLYENSTAEAFFKMLPMIINMEEMNGNEKYYSLPASLPSLTVRQDTVHNGDIMLYGSRTLVLFYETFPTSYIYTRIGRIDDTSGLKAALGTGDITVKFELE